MTAFAFGCGSTGPAQSNAVAKAAAKTAHVTVELSADHIGAAETVTVYLRNDGNAEYHHPWFEARPVCSNDPFVVELRHPTRGTVDDNSSLSCGAQRMAPIALTVQPGERIAIATLRLPAQDLSLDMSSGAPDVQQYEVSAMLPDGVHSADLWIRRPSRWQLANPSKQNIAENLLILLDVSLELAKTTAR